MLNRMKTAVVNILRQEQAGFCNGRLCCMQIYILWQNYRLGTDLSTSASYVSHKAFFGSVHWVSLWEILRCYGIPEKKTKEHRTEFLLWQQKQRWNQGPTLWLAWRMFICLTRLSALILLFVIVMDWCMKHAINATNLVQMQAWSKPNIQGWQICVLQMMQHWQMTLLVVWKLHIINGWEGS